MTSKTDKVPKQRRRSRTAEATRIRIMEAAEILFADRGIDGVALREIASAAGQGNNTAVQYHFGSKEQLVYDIFDYRSNLFEPLRHEMLKNAEASGRISDVRVLLQVLVLPHLTICDEKGAHPYSAFLAQYLTRSRAEGIAHPYDNPDVPVPALRRVRQLLAERCSHIPADVLRLRVGLVKLMFLNMLMRRDSGFPHFDQNIALGVLVDDTLDMMTAAIMTPFRHDGPPLFEIPVGTHQGVSSSST
ncbi:TetR/AcrR family transcriptional regulator [Croceicoccus ponticola]|uniref:TetR/AcrR family transcriptional regulator n=1 Tax=Croceicoccus ponticola TaxID=2217664 RepID=A0A437GZC3_9SPHN|nr:helix-turn-helix domain-containing protein [Croceicoccus ponticola]RVQ68680.1 TetR/AcrR family transcriptional regulator [Croceicoccus ponticola]